MDLVTADFETAWSVDFTLSKMTTESYVRDPRFETILCSFKVNNGPVFWVPKPQVKEAMLDLKLDQCAVLFHHAHFDALIMNHHYDVRPRLIVDTLGMARTLHGANARLSLAKLAELYGIGVKGDYVYNAKGKWFSDFTDRELHDYGEYGKTDVELTYKLAMRMMPQFTRTELEINDHVIRMFTEPSFELDTERLQAYADSIRAEKKRLIEESGTELAHLMSAEKFANELRKLGVEPPMKVSDKLSVKASEAAGKPVTVMAYSFAKTDPGMQALQEHPDEKVQILIEARLKNKTTIAEASADRMVGMSKRGRATIYGKYSGAATHRLSAGDKTNFFAMKRGGAVRESLMAPGEDLVVVRDSSNIEARMIDWLSGQEDMVEVYRMSDTIGPDGKPLGIDMYCTIGERIYLRPINKKDDPDERQMAKRVKLGLGFGMGVDKFIASTRAEAKDKDGKPLVLERQFAEYVHGVYRDAHKNVQKFWHRCGDALKHIRDGHTGMPVDYQGIVVTCKDGLLLPSGQKILFPDLKWTKSKSEDPREAWKGEWSFWNGKKREHIYGAKVAENIVQALSRIVVMYQCLDAVKECNKEAPGMVKWAHSVYDEGIFICHAYDAPFVLETAGRHMRTPLSWCQTLPLNSEGGFHKRYGMAKQ